jgi:hypothetical protein
MQQNQPGMTWLPYRRFVILNDSERFGTGSIGVSDLCSIAKVVRSI